MEVHGKRKTPTFFMKRRELMELEIVGLFLLNI